MKERTDARLLDNSAPCSRDTASEQANAFQRCLWVNSHDRDIRHYRVLREGGSAHLLEWVSIATTEFLLEMLTKWWTGWPLTVKREVLSGINP